MTWTAMPAWATRRTVGEEHVVKYGDSGVAVERWEHEARVGAIAAVRHQVAGFARRHGMSTARCADLGVAVSEAVADLVAPAGPHVIVDAATDGSCLSVRVAGEVWGRSDHEDLGLPLVAALAERVEWGPRTAGAGTSVLMEFAMGREGPASGSRCAARSRRAAARLRSQGCRR
jgi:hypothetical protein